MVIGVTRRAKSLYDRERRARATPIEWHPISGVTGTRGSCGLCANVNKDCSIQPQPT